MTTKIVSPAVDFFRLDDQLTPEERDVRDRVRAFAESDVLPVAQDCWERAEFPFELVPKLARLNVTGALASLAKMNHTEMAREVALHARELLGGNGILGEYHVMHHLCDLEASFTYEGTHDINMLVVGREITGVSAFK